MKILIQKIADFSFFKENKVIDNIIVGTDGYFSPERKSYNSIKYEIFSPGILLINIVKGYTVFSTKGKNYKETKRKKFYALNEKNMIYFGTDYQWLIEILKMNLKIWY